MSKDQQDTHLKYGQGLLIQGYKQKGDDLGFLTAKGFADIKVKYQTYDNILYFKNYRNAIFQMLPAGNFQLNDQLHKTLIQNQGKQQTPNIKILKARAKSQQNQFSLNIDNKNKNHVCFGNSVIFKHIDSQTYISGTIRPSSGSNGAFTVQVSDKLSQSLIFKLLPYRSFEFLGMPIPFDSPIIIKNEFNNGFLTFQKLGINNNMKQKGMYIQKKPIQSDQSYKIPVKTQSQTSQVYECVTHFVDLSTPKQVPMPWKFLLHFNDVDNDSLIQHDIVYLQHTQNQGVLSMDKGQIILKQMKQTPKNPGLKFYQCLWEIQKHDKTKDSYILRHLMSGQTLGKKTIQSENYNSMMKNNKVKIIPTLIDISAGQPQEELTIEQEQSKFGVIQLQLAKKQGGQIQSNSYINIAWGDLILQTQDQQSQLKYSQYLIKNTGLIDYVKMARRFKQSVQYTTRKLVFKKNTAQKHCFVIQQIDNDLKKQVLFALSFHSVIINLREDLKWGAIQAAKKIDYFRMMKVTQKIRQIKDFLKNCTTEQSDLQHILPVQKSQMICKDLGISELLFELLFYMKMNIKQQIFSDKHNQRQKLLELYNTIYQVIRQLIRKNRLFKMHVSKWIQFIFEDVINNNQKSHQDTLTQLLSENQFFVHEFVTEQLMKYLTGSMMKKLHQTSTFFQKKYLQIFRQFCITDNKVNTANQILIHHALIQQCLKSKKGEVLKFKLQTHKNNSDEILITAAIDKNNIKSYTFQQFYDICMSEDKYHAVWEYFVQYLNLVADMTQGRNKVTQLELATQFTLELLTNIFKKQNLYQAQVPILRILHYLYAQNQHYYPVQRKKKLVDFNSLNEQFEPTIISTSSQQKPWDSQFGVVLIQLVNKLIKISEIGPIDPKQYKRNQIIYQILNFIWQTLNLGFWKQKEQVKSILMSILKILQKKQDIVYEDVKNNSVENILMIKCKIQCLKIIQIIADYDQDLFVQAISKKFKQFQIPQKKRGISKQDISKNNFLILKPHNQISSKFISMIPQDDQLQHLIQTSIIDNMLQLSNYQNPQLTSMALSIVQRTLHTKKKALQHFYGQNYVCESDKLQLIQYIDSVRNLFFMMQDPNVTNINEQNQHKNYFLVYEPQNPNTLMTAMYNLSQLMKNENDISTIDSMKTLQTSNCYQYLSGQKLLNFTMQRSSTNQTKQNIVYSANLHQKILSYIFNCKQIPSQILAKKLLHLCYKFIVSLIQNYNQIKTIMIKQIPKMIHHIDQNVGCIDFLKEMYDNNKNMLYNQNQVFSLIKLICNTIDKQTQQSYYKSKLLDFFRYLIYCNGKNLQSIQIQILKIMQDDTYTNIMLSSLHMQKLPGLVDQYQKSNSNKKTDQFIQMSPQLTYMTTFFQISAGLIDGNNYSNMGKIIKKFPFDNLVRYIKQSKTCWALKRNIRTLLNRLYYFQPQIQTNLKCIIEDDFQNIINDLNMYIKIKNQPNAKDNQNMKYQSPVRFSYLQSYLYLNLQENFFTIYQLIIQQPCVKDLLICFNSQQNVTKDQSTYKFIRICQRLSLIRLFFVQNRNTYSNSMLKFILNKIKAILYKIDSKIFITNNNKQNFSDVIDNILSGENIKMFYQQYSIKITQNVPLVFFVSNKQQLHESKVQKQQNKNSLYQKLRFILKRQKRQFQSQDQKIRYKKQKLVNALKLAPRVNQFFFNQFKQKVTTYTIKKRRNDIYSYIQKIIQMNSNNNQVLPTHLKIFFLDMITFLVEQSNQTETQNQQINNENSQYSQGEQKSQNQQNIQQKQGEEQKLLNEQQNQQKNDKKQQQMSEQNQNPSRLPIDQWQPQDWQANQSQIKKTQDQLKRRNLSKFIVDLFKQNITQDIQFANSILLCSISYLLGGNNLTQKSILQQLNNDQQNKVFVNLMQLIDKLGKFIQKNITEYNITGQNQQNLFSPTTIDNYDYFDINQRYCCRKNVFQPNSIDQHLYHQLCIVTYRRAFKFLQLLCENNHIDGKHLIRQQPQKKKQVNFINVATKQLKNLFKKMCKEVSNVPIFLLDFILQVTQIPVKQNQQALMRSTFFQDLCQLQTKNIQQCQQAVQQIFFKSVQIILSNFQGNDQKTFISLDSKLSQQFLINIMQNKLSKLKIKDKHTGQQHSINSRQKLIKYINDYCNQQDQQGKKLTTFSQQLTQVLNVMIIFEKMKDKLTDKSKVRSCYDELKKKYRNQFEDKVYAKLIQQYANQNDKQFKKKFKQQCESYPCLYTYLQKCLLKIQITDNNNQQQTVYFPKSPVFNSLSGNLRDYVMSQVQRSTHRDKIVSLLGFTNGIKQKIQYSYNLQKKQKITQKNMNQSYNIAAGVSIVICLYMMVFYDIVVEYEAADFIATYYIGTGRFVLSLIQLSFSLIYTFYWYKLKIWYKPQRISRSNNQTQSQQNNQETDAQVQKQEQLQPQQPGILKKILNKLTIIPSLIRQLIINILKRLNIEIDTQSQNKFYQTGQFFRIAFFVFCSLIGTFFYPIMFFIHLIDIFCKIQVLANIFQAVAVNIKSLLYVSFMGVVFVFIFCTVTFSNYMKNVYSQGENVNQMCDDVLDCVMSLYVSGAIVETMEVFQFGRFTYDMIYLTFFDLLFGNIVQGIMLDAFSNLRQKNQQLDDDKSNICYICNMPRQMMQKKGQSFKQHTFNKHFLWNYVFYIIALQKKSSNDYTGLQYQISLKYNLPDEQMDVSWIPSKGQSEFNIAEEAAALTKIVKENNQTIQEQYQQLQSKIDEFNKVAHQYNM